MLHGVRDSLERLGFNRFLVLPLVFGEDLLGMLFLRARAAGSVHGVEIDSCQVVANASRMRSGTRCCSRRGQGGSAAQETADKLQNILVALPGPDLRHRSGGRLTEFSRGGGDVAG